MSRQSQQQFRDAFEDDKPPRTPPSQTDRYKPAKRGRQTRPSVRDTFADHITSNETEGSSGDPVDGRDSHDLSLSPTHAARTSIVDNMLLSLDQFAQTGFDLEDYRLYNSIFESDPYQMDSSDSPRRGPYRGHTYSSSISSNDDGAGSCIDRTVRGRRSNSSSNYRSGFGNGRIREVTHSRSVVDTRANGSRHSSGGSSCSNTDFGPARSKARLGSAGERRSASFDYGMRRAYMSLAESAYDHDTLLYNGIDAAPTPSVPAGPRKQFSTIQDDFSVHSLTNQLSQTPVSSRKSSLKSARTNHTRKSRPENLATDTVKNYNKSSGVVLQPPLESPAPSPSISFNKQHSPPAEQTSAKERPGFFRRVFGSSKTSAAEPSDRAEAQRPQESDQKVSDGRHTIPRGCRQRPQVVNKKPSFFRRRKKSVVDSAPPPIVLPQKLHNPKTADIMNAEPSPVSSLRQVMDPYIGNTASSAYLDPKEGRYPEKSGSDVEDKTSSAHLQTQKRRNSAAPLSEESKGRYSLDPTISSRDPNPSSSAVNIRGKGDYVAKFNDTEAGQHPPSLQKLDEARSFISAPDLSPATKDHFQEGLAGSRLSNGQNAGAVEELEEANAAGKVNNDDHTASSTPVTSTENQKPAEFTKGKAAISDDLADESPSVEDRERSRRLFDSPDEVIGDKPTAAWLGEPDRAMIRKAYMELFKWSNMDILAALRDMCTRLVLKGETQQVDRVLDAFSTRWCECNPNHGFKATDVVHTICYSILLLNTDLHLADIDQKMTKNQFVRNTMPTIHRVAVDAAPDSFGVPRAGDRPKAGDNASDYSFDADAGLLVNKPFNGTIRAWETQVEIVLRDFYTSIHKNRLPLHGSRLGNEESRVTPPNNLLSPTNGGLRRSPSTISKSGSDIFPRARSADSRYGGGARWSSKARSRARLYPPSYMGSSRTSLDDQSSLWSPSTSSTWSKYSLGKFTSVSVDSLGSDYPRGDYQQSIGFANALSHAIIREDSGNSIISSEASERATALLEDETLELAGAPWAKEGNLKHKHHLDGVDKRAKDRNWNECFAVIQQGWMRLFSFNESSRSVRQKVKQRQTGGVVVGGGNWTENAQETWKFLLRQTIASALPSPGYSKSRPHVWALSLPTGAVHLFQAGTPEIVREFVSTANYWSARLSKEPLIGGVSNVEYGWSESVANSALVHAENNKSPPSSSGRMSFQSSARGSIDQQSVRPRLPADRIHISDWAPPQQSMVASSLSEADQLQALRTYVKNVEDELQKHNDLRPAMTLAFSPRHPNASKAMANWERKSSYLLREIVKFRTYIDSLQGALDLKDKIYASRQDSISSGKDGEPEGVSEDALGPSSVPANI